MCQTESDIDLKNGIIDVNKTWDIYDQSGFMPTKNPQSVRLVLIDATTWLITEPNTGQQTT